MSLTGGSEEVAEFLRNYTLPPKALHKLHHLQVSSEAFTQQPAEILRLLGFMNELEIHNIVSDWREYSSTGYSPSYIDRLLDEFHQPNVLTDPSDDLTLSFSASFLDIPEAIAEEIPTESSVVQPKSVSFAPSPIVEKPKAESAPSLSSTKAEPLTSDPPAPSPAATNNTATSTTTATATATAASKATTQAVKDKPDLTDIIRELRALVDQRTVENDYLRLQNNNHVEDVERRAREYKELRDEYNQWKKTARETESKLRHAESLHQLTLAELEEAQKALGKKHTQLMRVQEDLQEQHLLSSDLEQEIFSLRKVIAGRKGVDVEIQSDKAMTRNTWTLIRGESVSIEPVEPTTAPPAAAVDIVLAIASSHDVIDRLLVSHINEEDDRLMSGDVGDTIGDGDDENDEVERRISLHGGSDRDDDRNGDRDGAGGDDDDDVVSTHQSSVGGVVETTDVGMNTDPLVSFDAETDTHGLHDDDEDFKPTSSRITVAKKGGGKVIQDPWPNLSYAQLLDKYRTLEEESTEWQKKQYQELIDAQSEVRRLEVVLVEQHEEANLYKERYEKLLVSSISEINETVMQEKAESAEVIATLQQQREGYLAKIAHLQASLAERDAVIEEKDREIQRLRRLLQGSGPGSGSGSGFAPSADTPPLSSRLPPNITEGRAIEVAQSTNGGGGGDASVETWSRERVKEKLSHEEVQEKHRWEEKEKLYLMNMDHLSASLKELTAVFHQQQEQLHQLLPPIHKDHYQQQLQDGAIGVVIESRNNNNNNGADFDPKATSFSDPGAGATALVSRGRPVPPGSNNGSSTQPMRPKTSHGPILSMGTAVTLSSSEGTGGHSSMKGRAFQHRHRALKAAVKTSNDGSVSPPRLMVVDANGSPLRVEQQLQQLPQQRQQYPDALYYVDDEGSDDGQVIFVEHQQQEEVHQRSPTTLTDHERKQLEKEEKDRLLAKAYDPESLRRIYFHPANKAVPPQRPSTGGAIKGPTSGGGSGGGRPSTGNRNRPSSSFGYKPQQKASTGKKHEKARPRASLVANFIQGLELRYHEDLARMIQLQHEQDGPFYEHLAQAVGQPQPQQPSILTQPQQPQQQERRTRPAAAADPATVASDPPLYPEMQYYYPQYPAPTTSSNAYSSSKGGHKNQHQSQPCDPPPQRISGAVVVSDIDGEEAATNRGHRGGGFFITVVPSSNTDPSGQRRSPRVVPNLPPSSTAATVVATAAAAGAGVGAGAGAGPTEPITEFSRPEQSQPQRPQQPVTREEMNVHMQKKFSKPKKPPSSTTNPNVSLPPQVMDIEQQPLPPQETLVVVKTPPRRRSRGHDAGPNQHHPTDGEVPLTSYPMMTMHSQHSISSVGSSSGHSSMAPSQFSSPSMVLHPSNSQPTDAFLLLLHQDSLHQDSLPHPQHPPQQEQQIPEIVFHQHHGLRAINRSSSASY